MKIYIENSKGYFACDDGHIYRNGVKLKGASSGTKAWILTKHQEGLSADKIVEVSANKNVTLDLVIQLTKT